MDIQLSGMDGTAMKQLKAARDSFNSGHGDHGIGDDPQQGNNVLAEGFDGFQTKPFDLTEFLADVARLVDQIAPDQSTLSQLCQNHLLELFESVNSIVPDLLHTLE